MPSAHADIRTDRAGRYLVQLCRHGSHMGSAIVHGLRGHRGGDASPRVRNADWTDTDGVIDFGWGRCAVRATDSALYLHAEADSAEHLEQIKAGIAARMNRIGRRDQLTVMWS